MPQKFERTIFQGIRVPQKGVGAAGILSSQSVLHTRSPVSLRPGAG